MFTPKEKIDYIYLATDITEWIERTYGYFVNKNSKKIEIRNDFAAQLDRLPINAMSYILQAKNNIFDKNMTHPPLPSEFISELRIIFNNSIAKQKNDSLHVVISVDSMGNKYVNKFSGNGKLISRTSFI